MSASYRNTAERRPLCLPGWRFTERNRAVVSAFITFSAALLAPLSVRAQQCSPSRAPQRGLCPGLSPCVMSVLQQQWGRPGLKQLPVWRCSAGSVPECSGQSAVLGAVGTASARCLGSEQHLLGQLWAAREVRPLSIPVVGVALLPGSDLLLLLCVCLQGTGSVQTYLCFNKEISKKAVKGCSKTSCFSCKKPRGEEVTIPLYLQLPVTSVCWRLSAVCFHLCMASYSVIPPVKVIRPFKSAF